MKLLRGACWVLGVTVVILAGMEIAGRLFFGLTPLRFARPYDPVLIAGDFYGEQTRRELLKATNAPSVYGYEEGPLGSFVWNGEVLPLSTTSRSDFLYEHYLSRYSSREVDDIICRQPNAISMFILGGSVAQGSSASSKQTTWHALLEQSLRSSLQRDDVFLFNAAMGAFVSAQERIAYHLSAFPRGAEFILFVNSANDLFLAASSGVRPGDPGGLGSRYSQFYASPLTFWLIERSALFHTVFRSRLVNSIVKLRRRLTEDDGFFERYADAVVSMYLENMFAVFRDCDANGSLCLVGIQPHRVLSASYLNVEAPRFVLPTKRVRQIYDVLFKKLASSRYSSRFIDLTHVIKNAEQLSYFADNVHPDDRGEKLLADALFPRVEAAVKDFKRKEQREMTISCDRVLSGTR